MKTIDLIQGTPEWHAHRASHFNASDAPAMMGCSSYKTRTQLLHELHTGIVPEVDAATQRRFDDGHRFEAMARPLAEDIIGQELYPVTGSEGNLSASFDGLTMMEDVDWEHKGLNDTLRACLPKGVVCHIGKDEFPLMYRVQMEQQMMISGAEKCLFSATNWDTGGKLLDERHGWYTPDLKLREQIIAGWEQFEIDLFAYTPTEVVPVAVAAPSMGLPAVSIQVNGSIALIDNLSLFGDALTAYIAKINTKPETDQDFADLDGAAKTMKRAEEQLEAAESNALAQTASIDTMRRTVAQYKELARQNRLLFERLFKTEKDNRKLAIVQKAKTAFEAHMTALNTRLGKPYMPAVSADFANATKGLKTITSMQNAIDTEMARAKIEANAIADKIQANLATLGELAGEDYIHLFSDTAQIVLKATDDFTALAKTRISEFKASEATRLEAEREKIRAEEVAKLAAVPAIVAPAVEVKPETVAPVLTVVASPVESKPVANVVYGKPHYTVTTLDQLTQLLGQLSEADLVRTLHFVQQRFFSEVTA